MTKSSGIAHVEALEPEDARSGDATQQRRAYVRQNILHQHLERAIRHMPSSSSQSAAQGLAISTALRSIASTSAAAYNDEPDTCTNLPVKLKPRIVAQLDQELRQTMLDIADYYSGGSDRAADKDACLAAATQLPQNIEARKASLAERKASLSECRANILRLIDAINSAHPALEVHLLTALETLPPQLRAARTAQAELLATTIETALLKLSLLRARAHRALYGFSLPPPGKPRSTPEATSERRTVARAVSNAYDALRARQRAQEKEMRELDGQIAAYEGVLGACGRTGGRERGVCASGE
ncbi:hypothetical protein NUW54_g12267 [Trametes sanguinea]|uniref:Uncharacterized protein n=1 Tax=Trametes sanguinea TaxID=158606 RepID=A0ACC1N0Z4_9APHY|nr:hypothetical protein NUW54_g12267 [Trametes sanguinea]